MEKEVVPMVGRCKNYKYNQTDFNMECADINDLDACLKNTSCQWSTNSKQCIENGSSLHTFSNDDADIVYGNKSEPSVKDKSCLVFTCDTCNLDTNCIWCETTESCLARSNVVLIHFFFFIIMCRVVMELFKLIALYLMMVVMVLHVVLIV
jgi:hypothetical protein